MPDTITPNDALSSGLSTEPPKKPNGLALFVEHCSSTAKAIMLVAAIGGAGLSAGLLFDDVLGVPRRVEANTVAIIAQDDRHVGIMEEADLVTKAFRDSILTVQSDILRTLRAWLCIESARTESKSTIHCGLQQLLPLRDEP